jgi:[amino group carrier protein]-lysine/ornithine hydrolase
VSYLSWVIVWREKGLRKYALRLLRQMLEIYSPSGSEAPLASFLSQEMAANGFATKLDHTGNVLARIGQTGPRILLCGHLDTIPGEIPVRVKDGAMHGRGAVDAKSSLAAMIVGSALGSRLCASPVQIDVAGVVEEETTGAGVKALTINQNQYTLAVFGEPSGVSNITIGYKGSIKLRIICRTAGGHSSSPWLSPNSIEEGIEFWKTIKRSILTEEDSSSRFSAITGSLTSIRAGNHSNTIPSECEMDVDIRIPPGTSPLGIGDRIEKLGGSYRQRKDVMIQIVVTSHTQPHLEDASSLGVRVFRSAIRNALGSDVALVKKTGTSDMNSLAATHRIPMVAYGPGDSSLDHTDDEHVSFDDYLASIEVYSRAIQRFATIMQRTQNS